MSPRLRAAAVLNRRQAGDSVRIDILLVAIFIAEFRCR